MDRDTNDPAKQAPSLSPTEARQGEVIIDTRPKQRRMIFYVIVLIIALALLFLALA